MKILRPSSHPAPAPSRALPAAALATIVGSLFALMPVASNANTDADPAMTNVVALAARRLALAEPVAKWKWAHHRPIQDAPREQALMSDITQRAVRHGIDEDFARQFFEDQMAAGEQLQAALCAQWRDAPPDGPGPDLAKVTQPQLDALDATLLPALARVQARRGTPDCPIRVARALVRLENDDGL
jgi:chorismate mutase